jgi:hypothetical protein
MFNTIAKVQKLSQKWKRENSGRRE